MSSVPSSDRVCEGIIRCLETGGGEHHVASLLNDKIKGLKLLREPKEEDLPVKPLRVVLRYWQKLPKLDGVANVLKVEPEQLVPALGYLMLVDVDEEKGDFRYALYGSKIALTAGFDMTGGYVSGIKTTSAIKIFFASCYKAAIVLRCPVYTVHEAPPEITASHWHRLILPLGKGGDIQRFLVCNVPILNGEPA